MSVVRALLFMLLGAVLALAAAAAVILFVPAVGELAVGPHSFAECAARFGTAEDSYPPKCTTPGGRTYQDDSISESQFVVYSDLGAPVASPLQIDIAAPSTNQGVVALLTDATGFELASTTLVEGQSMGLLVRQTGTLNFPVQISGTVGVLTFLKPGEPLSIPVVFK
jgi:hypothetical protein